MQTNTRDETEVKDLTVGLRKIADEWTVVHEHHSVPTIEKRFLA
jgi:ketosteroid isomerase-like protein